MTPAMGGGRHRWGIAAAVGVAVCVASVMLVPGGGDLDVLMVKVRLSQRIISCDFFSRFLAPSPPASSYTAPSPGRRDFRSHWRACDNSVGGTGSFTTWALQATGRAHLLPPVKSTQLLTELGRGRGSKKNMRPAPADGGWGGDGMGWGTWGNSGNTAPAMLPAMLPACLHRGRGSLLCDRLALISCSPPACACSLPA